ncbi:MAG TPA: hypothetical protein VFB96_10840 [Pirellulaceae bacterium]|nr:hypothetical protein [Pirellulaceae bacterium]
MTMVRCLFLAALAWISVVGGCGARQPLAPVDGIVTLDGQPLGNVLVVFVPDGSGGPVSRATGIADAAGRFELKTEDGRLGAAVGSYRIVVEDLALQDAPRDPDGTILVMPPTRIPDRYASTLTTTAAAQVEQGRRPMKVELSSGP